MEEVEDSGNTEEDAEEEMATDGEEEVADTNAEEERADTDAEEKMGEAEAPAVAFVTGCIAK